MKSVIVTLDGKEYTVNEKRHRDNSAWRKELEGPIKQLLGTVSDAQGTDITDIKGLIGAFDSVSSTLLGSIDIICDMLISYAPHLRSAVDEGFDSEILAAFKEVLSLAYPFGTLLKTIQALGAKVQ